MQEALGAATDEEPSAATQEKLLALWPKTSESLRQALEARMRDRTDGLQRALAERAEKEANDITTILTELQKTIQEELDQASEDVQLPLFSAPEKEQFDRNADALRARLRAIPDEIEKETEAIKARFADPQPRMFPVAVTYLLPARMAKG
jgi:membrane peptidoglycan carboxypeptidase